jgi:hypothetical protein
MVKMIVFCDERDCLEKKIGDIDDIKGLKWRCENHNERDDSREDNNK